MEGAANEFCCAGLRETWEDGRAFKDLTQRRAAVADAKEGIEVARKVICHSAIASPSKEHMLSLQWCVELAGLYG